MYKLAIRFVAMTLFVAVSAPKAGAVQTWNFLLDDPSQPYRMSMHFIGNDYHDSRTYLADGSATLTYDDIADTIDLTIQTVGSLYAFDLVGGVPQTDYNSGPVATNVASQTTMHLDNVTKQDSPFALLGDPDMNQSSGNFQIDTLALANDPTGASFGIVAKPMDWNLDPSTDGFIDEMRPYGLRTFWMYFAQHNWGDDRVLNPAELVFNAWFAAPGAVFVGTHQYNMISGDYHGSAGQDVTTPEPATFLLLGLGALFARRKRSA